MEPTAALRSFFSNYWHLVVSFLCLWIVVRYDCGVLMVSWVFSSCVESPSSLTCLLVVCLTAAVLLRLLLVGELLCRMVC